MKRTQPRNLSQANQEISVQSTKRELINFCPLCGYVMAKLEATFWLYAKDSQANLTLRVCICELGLPSEEEWKMNCIIASAPIGKGWHELYAAAVNETDKSKLSERIFDAEIALALRARELSQAPGEQLDEIKALGVARGVLQILRLTAGTNPNQARYHPRAAAA